MNKKSNFATIQMIVYYVAMVLCVIEGIVAALSTDDSMINSTIADALTTILGIFHLILLIGIFGFAIASIFYSVKRYQTKELGELLNGVLKIKLLTIPCYIINYVVCAFLCLMLICTIVASFAGIVLAVVLTVLTCLVIAATGAYGIAFVKAYNETHPGNQISKVHYALQVLPCLDVVSSIILISKFRKNP